VPFTVVEHREGRAVQVELPISSGWSVLRLLGPSHDEPDGGDPKGG
jgi:hypothetical protein